MKLVDFLLVAAAAAALSSCGEDDPMSLSPEGAADSDSDDDCAGSDTCTGADAAADADADTDADGDAGADTDTHMEGNCPWFCADLVDELSCSPTLEPPTAAYNPNFACATPDRICCQPVGAPGGIGACAEQSGHSCQAECSGEWLVPTAEYYCDSPLAVCCDDTEPTCTDVGGVCVYTWSSCPEGLATGSGLSCGVAQTCCAAPECPWSCAPLTDDLACSETLDPPAAIHNYQWSCYAAGEICCQPLGDTDGITAACADQAGATCRAGCLSYEAQRTEYVCDAATQMCCEDQRAPCEELGGSCNALWSCPDGTQQNQGGTCGGVSEVCCTTIDSDDTCALGGGTCVDWGTSCPLLMIPAPTVSCGTLAQMCCQWSWS
jgi:hypothetical protein